MATCMKTALTAAWVLSNARDPPPPLPQSISIPIVDDTLYEPREDFTVTLSNPNGAELDYAASTGTVTILNNDVSGS